ncbi:hypothetical protein [Fuerstiella marisgermanici]|uniref:hypothetical protein n=1 Tax=Fuerstiella marisgermanici TaxID=1891926 RepID=UPI00097BAF95|nr:hypothetical protein [Fuerstiella marisgermanici]
MNDWTVTSAGQYGSIDDPLDVAIYHLPQDSVERLDGKTFLRVDDIEFDDQPDTAVYTLFGYPAIWASTSTDTNTSVQLKPLQFTTYRFDGVTDGLGNYQDELHILLSGSSHDITDPDGQPVNYTKLNGDAAQFPRDLGGISGCSVWRIGDLQTSIEDWAVEKSRIVGVETSVYPSRNAIKASRWVAVSTLIHEAYPELRPAMNLWRQR